MRLTSLLVISALSSLTHISHAFPLKPQAPPKQPAVRRRVAYSVVAVDGGSVPTPSSASVPDLLTLIQTSDSVKTVTASASSTSPSIETIITTKTVSEMEPAKTVDIIFIQDITENPAPTTSPSYTLVNPAETPISSSTVPPPSQTFTSVSSVKCVISFSTSTLSSASTWTSIPAVSMSLASLNRASEAAQPAEAKNPEAKGPEAAASIPSPLQPPPPAVISSSTLPTASTKTYDDGMWHTSYPVWNATSTLLSGASATAVGTGRARNLWKKG
ncbi:hypothetical protein HO133_009786 [Letharia lupina]|uniref:Uncharacterized protein n=1 Tax=Letharia lupina TaxID=560253 RepID=A0A8H6FFC2_9LECA|nr:uncharacterized protein HO133_009786 [Letharia lupina]KAF6225784.1 hypothetical protein HO133_009786 [Letharia lupina]